jgi:hypothetical protein
MNFQPRTLPTSAFLVHRSAIACLALALAACSSNAGDGSTTDGDREGDDGKPTAPECDPTAPIPCFERLAEPCEGPESGFDGDEYCLAPPDPVLGFQVHTGPSDYDDPDQTDAYAIVPGEETNWAEVTEMPNDTTVFTRGYHSSMRPGSHHFIMYGMDEKPAGVGDGPIQNGDGADSAVGAVGGTFLGGATRAIQNIDTQGVYPEDQGIGSEIPAHRPIAMNLHFINTTDHALLQEIWVNFILIDEAEVVQFVRPIEWLGGLGMAVPPKSHALLQNPPGSCKPPQDLRVGMLTGHVHASTLRVTTTMNDSDVVLEDYDWHEPTEWRYRRDVENAAPDRATKTSGALSGLLEVHPTDTFEWQCEIQNETDATLHFGNKVYEAEMCNVFGFYFAPNRDAPNWTCLFF